MTFPVLSDAAAVQEGNGGRRQGLINLVRTSIQSLANGELDVAADVSWATVPCMSRTSLTGANSFS